MKLLILALIALLSFNCHSFEKVRILDKSVQTSSTITKYVDVSKFNSASVQFNWDGAASATATFYTSSQYDNWQHSALRYVSLDSLGMSSSATASYVKAFSSLPYKILKMVIATSATPTTVGIDLIGK